MMKYKFIILCFFGFQICYSQKIDWKNLPVEVKEPIQILDSDDEDGDAVYIGRCANIKWNNKDRHLYVSDVVNHQIHLYNEDLEWVKSLGRMGQGPGEFQYPVGRGFNSSNQLVVFDHYNARLQILNTKGQCLKSIININVRCPENYALVDHKDRIYVNLAGDGHLFSVFSMAGERLGEFGKTVSISGIHKKDAWLNMVGFSVDSTGIYCVFNEFPILRKYNLNWQLVYEIDLSECPEIIGRQKLVQLDQKRLNKAGSPGRSMHDFVKGVSLDGQYFYFNLHSSSVEGENCFSNVYVMEKNTGKIVKKIHLKTLGRAYPDMCYYPDFSDKKYIFAMRIDFCSLLKYHQ
ncbi:hypothetical protein KAR48_04225 [bacterium]|nr:hypothetical protein [bacterium]